MLTKIKKILIAIFLSIGIGSISFAQQSTPPTQSTTEKECKGGIRLNTNVPGIGNCLYTVGANGETTQNQNGTTVTSQNAFPILITRLTKFVMMIIVLVAFIMIILGGLKMSASGFDDSQYGEGKKMIFKAISAIVLLGVSGIILNIINPNFFK